VPVFQRDLGCCDALIGGEPGLAKGPARPRWRVWKFSPAEPSLGQSQKQGEYDMAKRKKSTFERLTKARLNRKERRQLERRLFSEDPGLAIVNPHAAGIDVGNESHFVAVPPGRDPQPVQEFGCWTADLIRMAEWLKACHIDTVAMQATGVYWIALYDILMQHGLRVVVVNAQSTKNVPGRKSDVQESQWVMKLHTYGLLRDSFRLPAHIEKVRTIWRVRDRHIKEASRSIQHMQKALTKMNVQLANVLSDISGVSGQAIIAAILKGQRDPYHLADLRDEHVKASREEVARSLEGNWREDVLFELQQAVDSYQFAHRQMQDCDEQLKKYLASLPTRTIEMPPPLAQAPGSAKKTKPRKKKKTTRNAPAEWDLQVELKRIFGVDLTSIDGINVMTAQTILSEIGTDLSAFPSENHFASWLGLTPSKDISGGKVIGRGQRKVQNRAAVGLRNAATTLLRSQTYLGGRYRHLRNRLPSHAAAVKAMARYLAVLIYRLLTKGPEWVDLGAAKFEEKRKHWEFEKLMSQAAAQGFVLTRITEVS
jgi:transposase